MRNQNTDTVDLVKVVVPRRVKLKKATKKNKKKVKPLLEH